MAECLTEKQKIIAEYWADSVGSYTPTGHCCQIAHFVSDRDNHDSNKDICLYFALTNALFGKRTNVRDAHDKYANQEVSFLLQQIENYPRLTILATNFKSNIDEAFTRRFHSIIEFSLPKAPERLLLRQRFNAPTRRT